VDRVKRILRRRFSGDTASHFGWTYFRRIAVAVPLLLCVGWSAFGQSLQPGHLPTKKQVAHMTPEEEKNLAFVLDWWREVIEARHIELAANYAAEDFIQHNPNIPTGRAALVMFFKSLGPAIEPIPDQLQNPPVVMGAKGNFVWLVFENKFKNPKDTHSQSMNTASICFAFKTGRYRSTGMPPGRTPVHLRSFRPQLRRPQAGTRRNPQRLNNRTWRAQHALRRMSSNMDTPRTSKSFFRHPSSSTIRSSLLTVKV
jgi:predicted SnoaL-like aldol condensation-catalyzing enzyme